MVTLIGMCGSKKLEAEGGMEPWTSVGERTRSLAEARTGTVMEDEGTSSDRLIDFQGWPFFSLSEAKT